MSERQAKNQCSPESHWPAIVGYVVSILGYFSVRWPVILGHLAFQECSEAVASAPMVGHISATITLAFQVCPTWLHRACLDVGRSLSFGTAAQGSRPHPCKDLCSTLELGQVGVQ